MKKNFVNDDVFLLQSILPKCLGKGNVHTQYATDVNFDRVQRALKSARKQIDTNEEMKYYVSNIELAKTVEGFDVDIYESSDEGSTYRAQYASVIEDIKGFDAEKFAAGKDAVTELGQQANTDFIPYHFDMAKLSDDLGDDRSNAALVAVIRFFERSDDTAEG